MRSPPKTAANPDQAIAVGLVDPQSWRARLLERANRATARASSGVVVLDRFVAERVAGRWRLGGELTILPPWPHQPHTSPVPHVDNPFRQRHGLGGKRVLMYSGNLSPVHPLDTILQAARELRDDPRLLFLFVGDGGQKARIEEAMRRESLSNVRLLPYQPLEELRYSLSAADVHLVVMGATMVGIVHPCKVYGAMAAARPILYVGPGRSHIGELVDGLGMGWQVDHGDVDGAVRILRELAELPDEALRERGERARQALSGDLSQAALVGRFCDLLERDVASGGRG